MIVSKAIGSIIAADTQATARSIDTALAHQGRMCADFAEACLDSKAPIIQTQPVLEALGKSLAGMIESRSHMSIATRELTRLQRNSNLRETSFGCPKGWVDLPSASVDYVLEEAKDA